MNTKRNILATTAVALAILGLSGCSNMTAQEKNTAIGAGVGAVGGAILTGGSAVGTVGGVIGHEVDKNK